ncbi:hypothetical protein LAZ67_4000302, partial [Cordylochernes scorpioides]
MVFESIEDTHTRERAATLFRAPPFSPLACVLMADGMSNLAPKDGPGSADQVPERPSNLSQAREKLAPKNGNLKNFNENSSESENYANSPAGDMHANPAAARGDVTAPKTAAATSATPASPASLNWADSEMAEVDANEDFTVVKSKKRRRTSTTPEHAAKQPSRPAEKPSSQQLKRPTGPRTVPPKEIKATRANIADAKARQASTNHENYIFVELCPDIPDYSYIRAIGDLVGGPKNIAHFGRMNGHYIVGLASKNLASRLVEEGLNIEGTLLKVFPFRKRAERIIVANLPGFVEDTSIVQALSQYGDITSIAPIMIKMGEFAFSDGRREAFILLNRGVRLETLPARLTIQSKGDTLSAFLSFGIKCSKCGRQGHRRASCPSLARQGNGSPRQAASPIGARPPPPPPPPPQQPRKPAPAPATPASPVQPAKTSTESPAIPSASHPAEPMDLAQPAHAALPAPLAVPRPLEPRISPLDHEMSVEKLTSPPSTPARGKAALEQLLEHLKKSPNISIDWDKLPDLNCEEAQKLLTSETTMKRRAPSLTPAQVKALNKLHDTIKPLCPDSNSTIRKTLQKTRKVLLEGRQHHVDIAFVQETNAFHLGSGQDLCLGYSAVVLAHPVAISGSGLACVFGPGVAVLEQRILWPGHIALATIDVRGEEMTAIAVHLAHEPRERNRQLELLAATAAQEEEGACWIIGDFNIRDRGPSSSSSSDALAALLDLAALVDVATQFDAAHLPTRVAMHGDQVESNRLDRILIPAGILDRVSIYATSHCHLSDHRLVLLQVGPPTTAVSSPTQPRLAAMLRSGLALEHLAGYIRELEEDAAHDDDDGTFWDRWTSIKAGLLAEARSLHDPRHAASDSYVYRARRYIAAQLEASSIRADYPSLPDLARAIRLRRPVSVIRDDEDNVIEGPELRRRAFATFRPRFARPTTDPAAGAAFIASSALTTTRELSEEDPLHRPDISPSEIANAIEHLPRGKAPGWDGLPCELLVAFSEDFFAEALARVFAASRLRGALPPSTRRSSICLVPKARGGRGLDGYRPVALPSADYRVLAAILHRRLKPHLRTLVPGCQTYAVPGRSPSWNIAMVTDAVEEATALGSPLAVMGVDLESAFDSLDRGFLESLLTSLRLPPAFLAWINILYAGADATIRAGGFHTTAFPLLNGLRQGCAVSAALFSIATGPLLRRLELTLGVGNVIAYADDIVLLLHRDEDFERVTTVFEDYKQASGVGVNLRKSAGLWCGAWRNRGDSPLGASWSTTSIRVLGLDIAPRSTVAHREQHLLALLETACRKWTPFTRGLSLSGEHAVGSVIQHHLHGYLPSPPTIAKLQARLARFVWGQDHTAWLPADVMARPVAIRGLGLLDLATQLQLACLKGVQVALRGGRNAFSWLVGGNSGEAWIHPPLDGTRLQPRRLRLVKLWEEASNILGLNHRAVPTAQLLDLPIIGRCRFLRPPDLLAPARWSGARVRDLIEEEHLIARPTRSALTDAAALGAFCRRLTSENAVGFGAESAPSSSSLSAAVVLRGTATPFLNGLTTRSARRALDRPRLAATPISRFLARWTPTINPPSRIDWASLRRCAYSGHEADAALKLALHALPHPAHPASVGSSCPACGSIDRSLGHRYWCCRSIRPLIREAFNIIGRPPDLQAWIFGGSGFEDDAISILASAKLRIYRYFVQVGLGEAVEDPLIAWSRTLQRRVEAADKDEDPTPFIQVKKRKASPPKSQPTKVAKSDSSAPKPAGKTRVFNRNPVAAIKNTRQQQQINKARSAAASFDQGCFIEWCPDFDHLCYMRALEEKLGRGSVFQLMRMSGHMLASLSSVEKAERLIEDGLTIGDTILRAFPYRKRAEKIIIGNLPIAVKEEDIVATLRPYCRVVSLAIEIVNCEGYSWATGNREAFILMNDGMKLHQLPGKVDIKSKGETTPAFITHGVKSSMCHRQGHRRASCPKRNREERPTNQQTPRQDPARLPPTTQTPSSAALAVTPPAALGRPQETPSKSVSAPAASTPVQPTPATSAAKSPAEGVPFSSKVSEAKLAVPTLPLPSVPRVQEESSREEETPKKASLALEQLKPHAVDVAFVQETNVLALNNVRDLCLGYSAVFAPSSTPRGSGLAVILAPGVSVLWHRVLWPGKIAIASVKIRGLETRVINCHLSHTPEERHLQLQIIAEEAIREDAWALGDINISEESSSDIGSGAVEAFAELLDRTALVDIAAIFDAAHLPTRVASYGSRVDAARLDRVLIPSRLSGRVTRYWTLNYRNSDHRAILLQVGDPPSPPAPSISALLRSAPVIERIEALLSEASQEIEGIRTGDLWGKWGKLKRELVEDIKCLYVPRVEDEDYVTRASRFLRSRLEAETVEADYPSLPELGRALRVRQHRPELTTVFDAQGNLFEGKSLRRYVFNSFRERFNGSTCSPEDIAGFLEGATECITLEDSDPLHRADISLNEVEVAISRLPQGKAAGWDGIPCELVKGFEDFFGGVIHQVLAESKLRGTLPESSRRNIICLVPKAHGGSGLSGYRPISLPTADYRIVSSVLLGRLRRHLPAIVPDCQTYAVPGRCPSWNIACVSDEVAQAFKNKTPLAVISTDLQSAFDNVDREFLASQLRIIGLPPPFMEWLHLLYAEADATIKVDGNFTRPFKMRRGLRQGCACSAALFSIFTGPLLRHLERILGRGNVLAYADDILLLIREDWQFERVKTVFDEFRRASGVSVNFPKSKGLWCGAWRDRADSPLGISWSASSITVLGCEITSGHGTSVQEYHLLGILERSISRWSPFVRGFSLVGRARAANSLVLAAVLHHLHGYLPGDATIAKLQARLTRFVWGSCHRAAWLPGGLLARPVSVGGVGLLDIRTQLQLACFKGVQAASRNGGKNAYSWLVESGAWMTPLSSGSWLLPRRRRLLDQWGQASSILGLNHRVLPAPTLLNLPLVGACRFLATPSLRAPSRWRGVRVRDLAGPAPPPIARLTRSACEDAAALGAFCQRLVADNATSIYRERTLEEAVVLRGTATPFLRISTRTARRMLERPRLAAVPISRYLRRWAPVVDVPSTSLASSSLRRCSFGGHAADIALRLALHALPHPGHPASSQPVCIACGSSDLSLAHRYWSCSAVRPLIREVFSIIGRPPDLQSWIFAVNLENHAITISSAAKHAIYVFFVDREMRGISGDPLAIFHQTLQRWQRRH